VNENHRSFRSATAVISMNFYAIEIWDVPFSLPPSGNWPGGLFGAAALVCGSSSGFGTMYKCGWGLWFKIKNNYKLYFNKINQNEYFYC